MDIQAQDIISALIASRNAAHDDLARVAALLAAKDREIASLKEKLAAAQKTAGHGPDIVPLPLPAQSEEPAHAA